MSVASATRCWPAHPAKEHQHGQAMVYGLFVLLGALVALFFLFNAGQLSREKTKLVNTSDAVAYSAGVMNARTLNYEAYTNRAMLANTVAIAQLVSLSSWIQYANNMSQYGGSILEDTKYSPFYPSYYTALESGPYLQEYLNESGTLEDLANASDEIIRDTLMTAQQAAYAGLVTARFDVMNEVAKANYLDDGVVVVDPISLSSGDLTDFVTRYEDDQRTRFAEAAQVAAKKDAFLLERNWDMVALMFGWKCFPMPDLLTRRGGTELIGFDEWKALDTLSEWAWYRNKSGTCHIQENPAAWGAQTAADESSMDLDPTHYGGSLATNPSATGMAMFMSSDDWDYSGLPNFYDLSESALKEDDPRLRYAVRLRREKTQTLTSEGRSEIKNSGSGNRLGQTLNAYQAQPAGGNDFVAISASEAFFSREGNAKDNVYGAGLSSSKPRETGSLFNPYWQVRLIQADDAIQAAQAQQGAVLP